MWEIKIFYLIYYEIIKAMKNIRVLSCSGVVYENLDILRKYEDIHAIRYYGFGGCDCLKYNSKVQYLDFGSKGREY